MLILKFGDQNMASYLNEVQTKDFHDKGMWL